MKTTFFTLYIALFTHLLVANENEKIIKSKPEKVTVYLQGAQVFRTSTVSLPQGQSTIIFDGLENSIDAQSIQASGIGNCTVTETQYLLHYPELQKLKVNGSTKYIKTLKLMNDSLSALAYDAENITNQREVLETEKNVLLNYGLYKGISKKDSLAFLKDGLLFLREKLNNINSELLRLKKEEAKLNLKIEGINVRKVEIENEINNRSNVTEGTSNPDYRIVVTIISDAPITTSIGINYFVPNAGWAPMYDLRTESVDKPMLLTYKATVFQNTGSDWKDVKLTLSTADPKQNFNIPTLNPYFVDAYKSITTKKTTGPLNPVTLSPSFNTTTTLGSSAIVTGTVPTQQDVVISSNEAYEYVVLDENLIQAEFEIKLSYTIPSDNKNHYVSILSKELPTKYIHKTIPKLDLKAYLTARITDYEELNLLPGKANVYFGGTYIGKTFLQTGTTSDTLELSLGQDKNVSVKRTKVKDKSKEKTLDNDKYYDVAYELVVKNGNSKSIEIEIIDQVPLIKNPQITFDKMDVNGANKDEVSGELKWRNIIKSKETKKNTFSFTVKAPKNMQLVVK